MTQLYVLSQDGTSAINLSQFEYVYIGEDNRIKAVNGQKMIRLGDYKSRDSAKSPLPRCCTTPERIRGLAGIR